ncbi:hypothetical protein QFZ27_003222 [Inquilinus ginsengisoli]|uniref:hypothetical protein n=1 Tax=Inquilinus ginsengisoli TaxID=363840 RepID=UPI003D20755F
MIDLAWIRQACDSQNMPVGECLQQIDHVGPNILFDVEYYRESYGADIPQGMTCLEHFCRQERDRPRNPNPLFSTQQWHETIGWQFPEAAKWRRELFTTMGAEARFSHEELRRQEARAVIIEDKEAGAPPRPDQDICLFVHYDSQDDVQDYVIDYVNALREQAVSIVFLSNSRKLRADAEAKLQGRVWRIVCTDNRAYDWGLYAVGVRLLDDLKITGHSILLANDSVVGTMNSLAPLFDVARSGRYEITGAVDSLLHDWHVQSFFIYCSSSIVASDAWTGFWRAYRPHNDRWYVVNSQEMGFARWMGRHSVSMGAAWRYEDILRNADNGRASKWRAKIINEQQITNPTIELWDILLRAGFPFLKKSLFTTPLQAANLSELCNILSARRGVAGMPAVDPGATKEEMVEPARKVSAG